MQAQKIVIKFGGHAMDHQDLCTAFTHDVAQLHSKGIQQSIVHGGGPQISSLLARLNIASRFEQGLRVTDEETMNVVEMALCGTVNKELVRQLHAAGTPAVGISGRDGTLLTAHVFNPALGRVGEVNHVNTALVRCLHDGGFVPVIAPVASDAQGAALNINADTAAGALAGALEADVFILISDVPGVLDDQKNLLATLTKHDIEALIAKGTIHSGMIPKVHACLHALAQGCRQALILDGRQPSSLLRFLLQKEALGTIILP